MIETLTLRNKEIDRQVLIDKTTSSYVLDEVDLGTIEATHQSSKYPSQIGSTNTGSTLGTRTISISGWVIGRTIDAIETYKQTLNVIINPLQMLEIQYNKYKLEFKPKNTIKYSTSHKENNEVLCKFLISGQCFDPLFKEMEETKIVMSAIVSTFHFPLEIPESGVIMSYRMPSLKAIITNSGTIETGLSIVFEAHGSVKNPKITNMSTGEFIQINKTMTAGEKIVICTEDSKESITSILNSTASNCFKYFDLASSWMQLKLGENVMIYGAEKNVDSLDVMLQYTNKYLEVQ